MILLFSVAGPQVAESWLSCGDSYGVWFSCGAGFPFARGVFNWDGVFVWVFPMDWGVPLGIFSWEGVSYPGVFLQGGAFQRWSFPKEVLYVMLDSVESNNRVYYSTFIHCTNSDFLIG